VFVECDPGKVRKGQQFQVLKQYPANWIMALETGKNAEFQLLFSKYMQSLKSEETVEHFSCL
jgi:hypothetical protein